jgi:hypothetical protein
MIGAEGYPWASNLLDIPTLAKRLAKAAGLQASTKGEQLL